MEFEQRVEQPVDKLSPTQIEQQLDQLSPDQMYDITVEAIFNFYQKEGVKRRIVDLKKLPKEEVKTWLLEHYDLAAYKNEVSQLLSECLTNSAQ